MIACSAREIWMGKQSSLGPIDPQFGPIPAHGVLEEFKKAYADITRDPRTIPIWQPIIAKYNPAFLGECQKAIDWSTSLVDSWLKRNMLEADPNRDIVTGYILRELANHSVSLAHNRHLSAKKCKEIGLKIFDLESDQKLQDKVLSVHHIFFQTLSSTPALKIIENQKGAAFILQVQQIMFTSPQMQQGGPIQPSLTQPVVANPPPDVEGGQLPEAPDSSRKI